MRYAVTFLALACYVWVGLRVVSSDETLPRWMWLASFVIGGLISSRLDDRSAHIFARRALAVTLCLICVPVGLLLIYLGVSVLAVVLAVLVS